MIAAPLLFCLLVADLPDGVRSHLDHGRYEEALEAIAGAEGDAASLALLRSRALIETGRYDAAREAVDNALKSEPRNADLIARRGELHLLRGDYASALADAESALVINPDHPAAHWCKAEALTETGEISEATDECRWFVRYYNRTQPTDAETLVYVAKGSLRYARWKRATSIFHFVINELCPDIAKSDPDDWRADAISGSLLVEKYNEAQGMPDLKRALAKNPNAAAVHATLAAAAFEDFDLDEASKHVATALKINPSLVQALGTKADLAIAEDDVESARKALDQALAINPHEQEILARLAVIEFVAANSDRDALDEVLNGIKSNDLSKLDRPTAFGRIVADLLERNPKPGRFLNRLGATFERRRLYSAAQQAYSTAIAVMPELAEPQVSLGLLSMRAGDLGEASEILDTAFKADPFNVRVGNMRKVIGLLQDYETIETAHFTIRFDGEKDRVLAELIAEYLESAYPDLTSEFGFEPPEKTTVELFQSGSGHSGHEWFSARMVGLPWIQTIGASTGLMVALSSPTPLQDYNWARVVRHEFVHVITLQQTEFRIPHWYTEALAVRSEGSPRPEEWDELLRERVPKGQLRSLDDLNAAFIRPNTPSDWQFAYCQSLLYAQFLDEKFGAAIHRKFLDGYARGLPTEQIVEESTKLSADVFDEQYQGYLGRIAEELGPGPDRDDPPSEEMAAALQSARAAVRREKFDDAITSLEAVLDHDRPDPDALELLGKLKLTTGDAVKAAELFSLGRKEFPHELRWLRFHVAALLKTGETANLKPLLEMLAANDPDDGLAAKKLAELTTESQDWAKTKQWAMRALQAMPRDPSIHDLLSRACDELNEPQRAETARRHAKLLREQPDAVDESAE